LLTGMSVGGVCAALDCVVAGVCAAPDCAAAGRDGPRLRASNAPR